jgi:hypothetical protein
MDNKTRILNLLYSLGYVSINILQEKINTNRLIMSNVKRQPSIEPFQDSSYKVDEKQGAIHFISANQCPVFITFEDTILNVGNNDVS